MKYKRMLCWLNQQDRKLLQNTNSQYNIPIVYSKNFNDFSSKINEDDYIVVSCSSLSSKYNKIVALTKQHSRKIFHIISRQNMNGQRELDFMCEPNVVSRQYGSNELIKEFLGEEEYIHLDDYSYKIWNS